jgi:hypothetical protein
MNKPKRLFICILIYLTAQTLLADPSYVSGTLVNGRGGSEKCDGVKISLIINSQTQATSYTNESGEFTFDMSGLTQDASDSPRDFTLDQNYPNPFNESTTLPFSLNNSGEVKLDIYDLRGHKVRSIVQDHHTQGSYYPRWNGRNDNDRLCPYGIYFYVLSINGQTEIRKMTFMNTQFYSSAPSAFAKPASDQLVELEISDRDIEDRTVSYTFSQLPTSLDAGTIPIHVYAFIQNGLDAIYAMEGEDARDTLDIYFERPFTLSSDDVNVDWEFTQDSLVAVHYTNIVKSPVVLRVNEPGESKNTYTRAYFNIDVRPAFWPRQLRRAFVGTPYSKQLLTENVSGSLQLSLQNSLPSPMTFSENTIEGTPIAASENILYFELEDDREIPVTDSALLIIDDYDDVSFNDYVLDVLKEYHRDGRYPYSWVSGYHGVTRNLYYKGTKIAKANADSSHSTYCSGLTFEVYYKSISRLNQDLVYGEDINGMTASNFSSFISKWFVQNLLGDGPGIALNAYGLGDKIPKMKDVIKGDFVQIWRTSGSGHSVIFINWTINTAGDTTGMQYWSTQTSTNGVNYNTEYFDGYGGTVDKAHTYYSRGRKPEDFTDF